MLLQISSLVHIIVVLFLPLPLGMCTVQILCRFFDIQQVQRNSYKLSVLYIIGLLLYLFLSFYLKVFQLPWILSAYLPFLLLLTYPKSIKQSFALMHIEYSASFLLWFFVVSSIGISLFSSTSGIQTPWVNNYGDLTFHLGMISSFIFGENIPPEYHIYAGQVLSYPFFMNWWSAILWFPAAGSWSTLSIIFCLQWLLLWVCVYHLLSGKRFVLLPWALLLGGGSYAILFQESSPNIVKGYPWTVFLTTIWVPQRTFSLGIVILLAVFFLFFCGIQRDEHRDLFTRPVTEQRLFAGIIAALVGGSFLAHGHTALFLCTFFAVLYLLRCVQWSFNKTKAKSRLFDSQAAAIAFLCFCVCFLCALPWIIGKAGIIEVMFGWLGTKTSVSGLNRLQASFFLWINNAWYCGFMLVPLIAFKKYRIEVFVCCLLFILFNAIQFATWEWDQLKLFIAIYCALLALFSYLPGKNARIVHITCLVLLVPALCESYSVFQKGTIFTVYEEAKLALATEIREKTPEGAIIAAAPEHHSAATLSGRSLFMGYIGTLWSHNIAYGDRERIMQTLDSVAHCKESEFGFTGKDLCPDYLLWDTHAESFWKRKQPVMKTGGFTEISPRLFKIGE